MASPAYIDEMGALGSGRPVLDTPERHLLLAVLLAAIEDARCDRGNARMWLRDQERATFGSARFICEHLNIEHAPLLAKLEDAWASVTATLSWSDLLGDDASVLGTAGPGTPSRALAGQGKPEAGQGEGTFPVTRGPAAQAMASQVAATQGEEVARGEA